MTHEPNNSHQENKGLMVLKMQTDTLTSRIYFDSLDIDSHLANVRLSGTLYRAFIRSLGKRYSASVRIPYRPGFFKDFTVFSFDFTPTWSFWHTHLSAMYDVASLPVHLAGFIVPLINLHPSARLSEKILQEQRQYLAAIQRRGLLEFNVPTIGIYLRQHHHNYRTEELVESVLPQSPQIIDRHMDDLDTLPQDILALLGERSHFHSLQSRGNWTISGLPDTGVEIDSIGVGQGASERFVKRVISTLVPQNVEFSIWVEAGKSEKVTGRLQDFLQSHYADQDYWLFYQDTPLAFFEFAHIVTEGRVDGIFKAAACHMYIEYNNMVFDSWKAFREPIPINEYQSNIVSSWRRGFKVELSMTIGEAEATLADLIKQAVIQLD